MFKKELGDPDVGETSPSANFVFILCTSDDFIPPALLEAMHVIKIQDGTTATVAATVTAAATTPESGGDRGSGLDEVAAMLGAKEIIRNSPELVEAGFDGDLDEVRRRCPDYCYCCRC